MRKMFASRACRSSVMIGTALNKAEMVKVCVSSYRHRKHFEFGGGGGAVVVANPPCYTADIGARGAASSVAYVYSALMLVNGT